VRKITQNVVGVISLGVLATSWTIGQAAETGLVLAGPTSSPAPTGSAAPSASPEPAGSGSPEPTQSPNSNQSAKPTPQPAKKISKTGGVITYKVQGYTYQIQLKVTKDGDSISSISNLIAEATKFGKTDFTVAFPYLEEMALAASSSKFSNVGGATFTSEAYKKALESALAKF
jgi:uncharacterized protein with FMN-binding domain